MAPLFNFFPLHPLYPPHLVIRIKIGEKWVPVSVPGKRSGLEVGHLRLWSHAHLLAVMRNADSVSVEARLTGEKMNIRGERTGLLKSQLGPFNLTPINSPFLATLSITSDLSLSMSD